MVVTVHQPEHLPWLGFFDKAIRADLFVILDCVQFRKNYFQNRNKIRTKDGWIWITLPIKKPLVVPICDVRIETDSRLRQKYLNLISTHYQKSEFYDLYYSDIRDIILSSSDRLAEINLALLNLSMDAMGIKTRMLCASELDVEIGKGGTRVNLSICRSVGATSYLSGISGKEYLDQEEFFKSGIELDFQEFYHPIYKQMHEPFLPCMSVLDLLSNYGPASLDVLNGIGIDRIPTLFE